VGLIGPTDAEASGLGPGADELLEPGTAAPALELIVGHVGDGSRGIRWTRARIRNVRDPRPLERPFIYSEVAATRRGVDRRLDWETHQDSAIAVWYLR